MVPGGRDIGAYLVSHPNVDKVAFTGSTGGGRAVAAACAEQLRPVTLELGGRSAAIILDDADLNLATVGQSLFAATLANNGQVCFQGTRISAPRSRYDEVVDTFAMVAKKRNIKLDEATLIGPMASETQRERVSHYIDIGTREGARVVVGGAGRPAGTDRGWFVKPTLFADLDNSATVSREEIFGPVLSVIAYDGDDHAVRIANDSDYGLGGSIWSSDPERALNVAREIETGSVGINGYLPDPTSPFGGVKSSGLGREFGPEGLASFQQLKCIYRFA